MTPDELEKEAERILAIARNPETLEPGHIELAVERLRAVHARGFAEGIEKAATACKEREEDEASKAGHYMGHMREQSIAMADCAGELCEQIRALKIGDGK